MLTSCASKTRTPDYIECTLDELAVHLRALLRGEVGVVLVKRAMTHGECHRLRENFETSAGIHRREDGVSARMVGSTAYLKEASMILEESRRHSTHAELLFTGVSNTYRELYDKVEDAGYRFRPAYIDGVPAPTHRASVWDDSADLDLLLKAHTDWPQVRHSDLEFKDVEHPVAINLYASHPPIGSSWVRIYDFVPARDWLEARGIAKSGYPILMRDLEHVRYLDVEPEKGDLLLFAASRVHAVFRAMGTEPAERLNVNGFIGFSPVAGRVLAWA